MQQPSSPASSPQKRAIPWTLPWYAQCLWDQSPTQAIILFHILVHTQHQPEATPEVLSQLNQWTVEEAPDAIRELQGPWHFIRGSGSSLTVRMELTTLDDQHQFSLWGLVDSGCTGSSIDSGFVKAKGLNAQPLPHPIPVYNADGTLNSGGMIMHTLTLWMSIGKHSEQITLKVTLCICILLCQKERWQTSSSTRLLPAKRDHCKK